MRFVALNLQSYTPLFHNETIREMRKMRNRISTKILAVLLVTSLLPLAIAGVTGYRSGSNIHEIATQASEETAELAMSDSMAALLREKEIDLQVRTAGVAHNINAILTRVEADTAELAAFATFLYAHPDSFGNYPLTSEYGFDEHGVFGSLVENESSWVMVADSGLDADGQPGAALMEEVYLTEFLDERFRSIAASNPYAIQLYLNTASQITRGMPFIEGEYVWVDGPAQFPRDMDLSSFDFYYLADAAHNPAREPVWTELYWDPAGLGWMVSSIAPVYHDDTLMGVAGIDITLGKMIDDIINVQLEQTGFAFLMSSSGQAIAFPERAADFLGFTGSLEGDFGNDVEFSFYLTEQADPDFNAIITAMLAGEAGLTDYHQVKGETAVDYLFAYNPVPLTQWSVGIVVPRSEVIAPALATNAQIEQNVARTSADIAQRSQEFISTYVLIVFGIVLGIVPISMIFSRSISNPIHELEEGSRKIGGGDLAHRITVHSGDEIEKLATTFNQMAADLQSKITEIEAANAELKKLDELKSQFISMASHELRTPLIAIQGYVDLLREGDAGAINPEQMQMLQVVSRNATRLARIVSELLDLSRIEENKLVISRESIDVAQLLHEIAEEQKPTIDRRAHTLVLEIAPDLPPLVADRDRVVQVVINLLGNAIKYTPDGGQITVGAYREGAHLHLFVRDSGIGIPAESLDKIFSRFYTAVDVTQHKSGKEAFMAGGTGLGLPIVKGIVEAHAGQVWAESQVGAGTTMHVLLPLPEQMEVETAVSPPTVYKAATFDQHTDAAIQTNGVTRVLIIDDEPDPMEVTARMLGASYHVLKASTSGTGLKAAMTEHPDLIMLDAWMPGISGYDVCKTLKNNANTRHIPIIMVTAATQQADEAQAQQAGADGFITKPFQKTDLLSLIEGFKHG